MSTSLSNFPEMGDFRYEVAAYHLNKFIEELDSDNNTPPVGVTFNTGGDWLQDNGAFKLNTLTKFLMTHKGVKDLEQIPEGVDWQYLNQSRLLRFIGTHSSPSALFPIDTIVVFGASIMAQSFSGDNQAVTEQLYANKGATVTVHERATSGDDTDRMVAKLPAIIDEFKANAERTLFVIHWGGNDVSHNGPYSGGADTMRTNCRQMLQDLKGAGFKIALSTISYRIPPASNDTVPYNENVMIPLIEEFADIHLDLHTMTYEMKDIGIEVDGIHPNTAGEDLIRKYVVNNTYIYFSNLGPIPDPTTWKDVLLSFGQGNVFPDGSNKLFSSLTVLNSVKNKDLSVVPNASVELAVVDGHTNQGRGNVDDPTDTSLTLTNNTGLKNYCYTQDKNLEIKFLSGLEPTATYTVRFTSSRAANDVRDNLVSVGDAANSQIINSTASPAEQLTFTGVLGQKLLDYGIIVAPSGSTNYAYVSMIEIIKESLS